MTQTRQNKTLGTPARVTPERQPTNKRPGADSTLRPGWDVPKSRECLMCHTPFDSAWSGERLCKPCKQKQTWRNGMAATPSSYQQGRGGAKGRS